MLRAVPVLAAALPLLLLAWASAAASGHDRADPPPFQEAALRCGGLAPFQRACEAGPLLAGERAVLKLAVFGFVGRVHLSLDQEAGAHRLACDTAVLPAATAECEGSGDLRPGLPARLRCEVSRAGPGEGPSLGAGPAGPWRCEVLMTYWAP